MIRLIIDRGIAVPIEVMVPECWDELNANQLQAIVLALRLASDPTKQKLLVARAVVPLPSKIFDRLASADIQESLFPLTAWVFESLDFSKQLMPVLKTHKGLIIGPKSGLVNITLAEWDFAEMELLNLRDGSFSLESLARLCAVLYRPAKKRYDFTKDPDGDAREVFNSNKTEHLKKVIQKSVPVAVQLAVLLWYRGSRLSVIKSFPDIFSGAEGDDSGDSGYYDLMRCIAKEGIYGSFDKVEQMYLGNALHEIQCARKEADKIKQNQHAT